MTDKWLPGSGLRAGAAGMGRVGARSSYGTAEAMSLLFVVRVWMRGGNPTSQKRDVGHPAQDDGGGRVMGRAFSPWALWGLPT